MSGDQDAEAAAKAALATATAAATPSKTEQKEGEISIEATVAPSEAIEAKKKLVLKRKASSEQVVPVEAKACAVESPRASVKKGGPSKPVEEEDTESEPEKQPKKRVKTSKKEPKTGGRRKKTPQSDDDDDDDVDEEQKEVERKVGALSDEIKGRFGQIVWAKMGGYPYWPCIITDPRLLSSKLQETAVKVLETKYLVFFYVSKNFAPVSFQVD
uniref:PWWP domain-containing protein n=1 Tax=Peronospora matthiolae TaxID=2874970 RepID=A0AAV1T8L3_9STRA